MNTLPELTSLCKGSVSVFCNPHRDYYETVDEYLDESERAGIPAEILAVMLEKDTAICVQFYPNTPVGFFEVYHYDIDAALARAVEIVKAKAN